MQTTASAQLLRIRAPYLDQGAGILIRKRLQKGRVDHTEDGSVGSNA